MHGLVSICLVALALFAQGYQCIPAGEQPVSHANLQFHCVYFGIRFLNFNGLRIHFEWLYIELLDAIKKIM